MEHIDIKGSWYHKLNREIFTSNPRNYCLYTLHSVTDTIHSSSTVRTYVQFINKKKGYTFPILNPLKLWQTYQKIIFLVSFTIYEKGIEIFDDSNVKWMVCICASKEQVVSYICVMCVRRVTIYKKGRCFIFLLSILFLVYFI